MSDLVARTGRLQQRYEAGFRLIAGCIPFRYRSSNEEDDEVVEVLMINSTSGPGLLFPKGGWENDETVEEAAVREAIEEAGVRGDLMELGHTYGDMTLQELSKYIEKLGKKLNILVSHTHIRVQDFIGFYHFKSKTHQDEFSPEGLCKAAMFGLFVKEELDTWPEQSTRTRNWLTIPKALQSCRHEWMKDALENGFCKWLAQNK